MAIRRINVAVPEEALDILDRYQKEKGHRTRDTAIEEILMGLEKGLGKKEAKA